MTDTALRFALEDAGLRLGGSSVLSGVHFTVEPGEAVALVGPSGAGKTSLLRLLNGSLRPTNGSVRIEATNLADAQSGVLRELRARIGFVPQGLGLVPNLRVAQNVMAGRVGRLGLLASMRAMLRQTRAELEEIHALLEDLGIADKLFQRVDTLSGGEQQRVAIARALFQQPDALLADEPLAALDPARAKETLELLLNLARKRGLTVVTSLHDLALARAEVPRLIGLRDGQVQFDRSAETLTELELEQLYGLASEEPRRG